VEEENLPDPNRGAILEFRGGSAMHDPRPGRRIRAAALAAGRRLFLAPRRFDRWLRRLPPARAALCGYLVYVLIGWLLLLLPWAHARTGISSLDHLFVAASAVSTTGLTPLSTGGDYTLCGQAVILCLIQLGGLGYMTLGSFLVLSRTEALAASRARIGHMVFALPANYRIEDVVRNVIRFTFVVELMGALVLWFFLARAGVPDPLWSGVFHSVSSFCTAGFSLYDQSLSAFAGRGPVVFVVAILSYLGAMGFIVAIDVLRKLRNPGHRITLTTRIILAMTVAMALLGTALLLFTEPSLAGRAPADRVLAAFFQAMTAMTTVGFNTVDIAAFSRAFILLLFVLMVIGASPAGTGGGLKCTTLSAIAGVMRSTLRGEHTVTFFGQAVPAARILAAVASAGFYVLALILGSWLLELVEDHTFEAVVFEAASALGTVGLSLGITGGLSVAGKAVIIVLMIAGRVGPLAFGMALFAKRAEEPPVRPVPGDLAV
jgi:trk system potassium uptake protein TrkH